MKLERGPEERSCGRQGEVGQVRVREEVAGDIVPASWVLGKWVGHREQSANIPVRRQWRAGCTSSVTFSSSFTLSRFPHLPNGAFVGVNKQHVLAQQMTGRGIFSDRREQGQQGHGQGRQQSLLTLSLLSCLQGAASHSTSIFCCGPRASLH